MSEESIKVLGRFRPISNSEKRHEAEEALIDVPPVFVSSQSVRLARSDEKKPYQCTLDQIFPPESTQEQVFLKIGKPMVDAALDGYNATIFCYGQSGAGKSFTMFGPEPSKDKQINKELNGIVPRCIEYLLASLNERLNLLSAALAGESQLHESDEDENKPSLIKEWKVYVEFIQIYKTDLMDLLDAKSDKKLRIRQNFQTDTTQVENLSKISITTTKDFERSLLKAIGNRVTAKHALNEVSSRSHMLVMLSVEQQMVDASVRTSRLNFGDLAGSEDVTKALGPNPDPDRMKEAIEINRSLSALTTAISMLSQGRKPSYRSSALTYILQDSLGGNSKTTMIVNASPHIRNRPETIRTLRFAETAKKVKNRAKVNDRLTRAQLERKIIELEAENAQLKAELVQWEHGRVLSPTESKEEISDMVMIPEDAEDDEDPRPPSHTEETDTQSEDDQNPEEVSRTQDRQNRSASDQDTLTVPQIVGGRILEKRSSHSYTISAPQLRKGQEHDGRNGPFISSAGLMRHASLTTGLAVIQPHEASTLLGMKVLREEIEKLARLLKREQEENEEYYQKNIQLEREVETLQTKLRECQEKVDRLERVFNSFNNLHNTADSDTLESPLEEMKSESQEIDPSMIGAVSGNMNALLRQSEQQLQTISKLDKVVIELQKENMKLQYMKEMDDEKIRDLTQQLLVVETLLDTSSDDSASASEDEEE